MDPADFYTGIVPAVYTALRGTHFDAARYRDFVAAHGTPALELGCGDDGPFFELAAEGRDIEGVDSSGDMVRRGRERLAAKGVDAPVHHARMEDLDLGRRFASIFLAGPTFNLLPDDDTARHALRAIARHLEPDGAALVPLWTPSPTPDDEIGVVRTADVGAASARYTVLGEDHDATRRTRTTRVRYELTGDAESVVEDREWVIHWHEPDGFRRLAAKAGLAAELVEVDDSQQEALLRVLDGDGAP